MPAVVIDLRAETLEQAAQLLVLRHDTLRIIDGAGPSVEAPPSESTEQGNESWMEPEQEVAQVREKPNVTETNVLAGDSTRPAKAIKCTFCEVVPIDLQVFQASDTRLVECPNCGATRTLEPHRGVLRFKSHDRRKTNAPVVSKRWARRETTWKVVGGEENHL